TYPSRGADCARRPAHAVAGAAERLSPGVRRYRHVSLAGDRPLARLGPPGLLQFFSPLVAYATDDVACHRRAGAARRVAAAPAAAMRVPEHVRLVAGSRRGGAVRRLALAVVRLAAHARCVHRPAGDRA